tara:strand:- start:177 stop:428 length:252 start_codon:yes stop_codon:yes gene_type:complete
MRELILEYYGGSDDILFADGFDDCIIGFEPNLWKVVYSRNLCINLMKDMLEDEEEAIEYLEYNTFSAYVGPKTPIWVEDFNWK